MMTTNLFVITNVQQLRTGGSFRIWLPFFRTSWGVGVLNSANFNSFHNWVEFGTILEGLRNFWGRFQSPNPRPSARHWKQWYNRRRPSARHNHRWRTLPCLVAALPPKCKSVLQSSQTLRGVNWWLITDVSLMLGPWRWERWVGLKWRCRSIHAESQGIEDPLSVDTASRVWNNGRLPPSAPPPSKHHSLIPT